METRILDCTLRDGGHVNNWNFGLNTIKNIITSLNSGGIDIIEIGFLRDIEYDQKIALFNNISQADEIINSLNLTSKVSLMVRPDWINLSFLKKSTSINIIRFAFYEKDIDLTITQANIARDAGYEIFLNPVNILSYSEESLIKILNKIDKIKPNGVSIVDTHGGLLPENLENIIPIFDEHLNPDIALGIHLHQNLAISFGLAQIFLKKKLKNRTKIVDSSLLGMGRAPGNLQTEIITQFINQSSPNRFDLNPILKSINDSIIPIRSEFKWGYSPEYSISGMLKVHRTYAEHLTDIENVDLATSLKIMTEVVKLGKANTFDLQLLKKLIKDFV